MTANKEVQASRAGPRGDGERDVPAGPRYDNGVDVGTVAAQLGQSPKVALKYYRQSTGQTKRRAVALAGIGEPVESNVVDLSAGRARNRSGPGE